MKLGTKLGVVLVLIAVVLGLLVLGSVESFKRDAIESEREDVAQTANLTAEQVSANVLEKKDVASSYAIRTNLASFAETEPKLRQFLNVTDFDQAQLVAGNGTVVEFWGDDVTADQRRSVVGRDVSDAAYFQRAIAGDRFVELLGPSQVSRTDRRVVLVSVPVGLSQEGDAQGVFVAGVFVETDRQARQTQLNQSSTLFEFIAPQERTTQSVRVVGRNVSDREVAIYGHHREFDRNFSASATARTGAGQDWRVTVVRDRSTLDERVGRLQRIQFGGLLLVLGVVVVFGYWEYSTNLRQTEKLLEGFAALESGTFEHRLSLRAAEEWKQIGDGFNQLAAGLKDRERAIREREERLAVLNRVLRHNLQNDMNVIIAYAELIPDLDGEELDDAIDTILRKGTGLVEHGRKARQVEEAMQSAEAGIVEQDLSEVVEHVVTDLRGEYPDATIDNNLPDSVPIAGIEGLRFAVESVCENGLEHTDSDEPHVTIDIEREPDAIALLIADNGPGIPEYEVEAVAEGDETALDHGSGLGLFLATWITEKSGGQITFETPDDGGTIATLALPTPDSVGAGRD